MVLNPDHTLASPLGAFQKYCCLGPISDQLNLSLREEPQHWNFFKAPQVILMHRESENCSSQQGPTLQRVSSARG